PCREGLDQGPYGGEPQPSPRSGGSGRGEQEGDTSRHDAPAACPARAVLASSSGVLLDVHARLQAHRRRVR
ncbi:hypothetical protein RFY99_19805, partial [Acinetobacter baumannii]|nr:hypothetical protein [Acinetobacter baumannii]